jgi:hypothetical protein
VRKYESSYQSILMQYGKLKTSTNMRDFRTYRPERDISRVLPIQGPVPRELSSQIGAHALAKEIEAWWHTRGYPQVKAWVSDAPHVSSKGNIYAVKTNLVRGMPPR